jgi:hypothetical protein
MAHNPTQQSNKIEYSCKVLSEYGFIWQTGLKNICITQ